MPPADEADGPDEASGSDEWDEPSEADDLDDGFVCGNCKRGRCGRCKDAACNCCFGGDPEPWPL